MIDEYLNKAGLTYYETTIKRRLNEKEVKQNNLLWGSSDFTPFYNNNAASGGWCASSGGNGIVEIKDVDDAPLDTIKKKASITGNTSGNRDIALKSIGLELNKEYTLSGYRKITGTTTSVKSQIRAWAYKVNKTAGVDKAETIDNTEWEYFTYTFKITNQEFERMPVGIMLGVSGKGDIEYCGLKLEEGSEATPFCGSINDGLNLYQGEIALDKREGAVASLEVDIKSELYDGKTILVPFAYAGAANMTLTVNTPTNTSETLNVFYNNTTRLGTQYGVGSLVPLTYVMKNNAWYVKADANTQDKIESYNVRSANALVIKEAVTANSLICSDGSGYTELKAGSTFNISYRVLYTVNAINAGATSTTTWLTRASINWTNVKTGFSETKNKALYLVGTLDGTTFTVDNTILTTTQPTKEDGKVYMPLGVMYSNTQAFFISPASSEIYHYINGKFRLYSEQEKVQEWGSSSFTFVDGETASYTTTNNASQEARASKTGRIVNLTGSAKTLKARENTDTFKICTVPAGCEPLHDVRLRQQGTGQNSFLMVVKTNGEIWCERYGVATNVAVGNNVWLNMNATYISKN